MADGRRLTRPDIPVRESSLAHGERLRLMIMDRRLLREESRASLKRKLSEPSLKAGSLEHINLSMEELENERSHQEDVQDILEINRLNSRVSMAEFKTQQRVVNRKILSIGDDLCRLRSKKRRLEENAGRIDKLTPDSRGAFLQALLQLYHNPYDPKSKRVRDVQKAMRSTSIVEYAASPFDDECEATPPVDPSWLWCPVLQSFVAPKDIKAAHIIPRTMRPGLADYIFGEGKGEEIDTAKNCMLLHHVVEAAFDKGHLVFLPINRDETPIRRYKLRITNDDVWNQKVDLPGVATMGELDGRELKFMSEHRPRARFLYYNFVMTLLRCRHFKTKGWERVWSELKGGKPWPIIGRYMRKSMLVVLATLAQDATEEEIEKMSEAFDYDTMMKLAQPEVENPSPLKEDDEEQ